MQSREFIPNLEKSDLNSAQQFTFTGMEFLKQNSTVRVPLDCMESILFESQIKQFLTQTRVLAQTYLSLLGKLSAAADLVHCNTSIAWPVGSKADGVISDYTL